MTLGTLTELSDSVGQINTSDNLTMFAGFQKAFVVNGAKLYVADFVNTRLEYNTFSEMPKWGDILQQQTSNAQMFVDHIDSTNKHIYGYTSTSGWDLTHNVDNKTSGTNSIFTTTTHPVSVSDARPFWYKWEVNPDYVRSALTISSGVMPAKAYLGCLYRGRCVLSGNPEQPYQWWTSRTTNPWDWLVVPNDSFSPFYGGVHVAGQTNDIITALAPYQDDYMIIGMSNQVAVLRGDPAAGGSCDLVTTTTGIFGANSWCFDNNKNFYFLGNNGIYRMAEGLGIPENLTQNTIPTLVKDLQLNASVHRVTMAYDRDMHGILIAKTTLSTGENQNYWYDLRTQGFFPETYPDTCGVYSSVFYDSLGASYRRLLVGCTDGYIRFFDTTSKNDVETANSTAIDSWVSVGPVKIAQNENSRGRVNSTTIVMGGDAAATETNQSDPITYELFAGNAAEDVISQVKADATPLITGTTTAGEGRKARIRVKARGNYIASRISNDIIDRGFALEKVVLEVVPAGKADI